MLNKKIKTLIIGLGNIGFKYDLMSKNKDYFKSHTKSILNSNGFDLLGGVDKDQNSRKQFTSKFKLPAYENIITAIKAHKPKLVVVSTKEISHLKIIKIISKFSSIRFVVLEKPAGKNYKDLKNIISICKKKNIKLLINYFRLYNPYFINIINYLKNKKLFVSFVYNRGIQNNCSHLISFLFFITMPKKVTDVKIEKLSNNKTKILGLKWGKISCSLINPGVRNLSHTRLEIYSKNKHFISNNNFSEFEIGKLKKSKLIKNFYEFKNYVSHKNNYKNSYQKIFYKNFKKNIKIQNKFNKIFLMTSQLLEKLKKFEVDY